MLKREIRKYYLEKRNELTIGKVEELSNELANQFFNEIDLSNVSCLHVFIPIVKFNEINTWLIIDKIWNEFPHIEIATSITKKDKLIHCLINRETQFVDDKWGIPIPQNVAFITPDKIDLVITPLLAFDEKLNRVGYGKGYYDKFFAECKPNLQKIGVSLFTVLENEIEDVNEFDVALDRVINP